MYIGTCSHHTIICSSYSKRITWGKAELLHSCLCKYWMKLSNQPNQWPRAFLAVLSNLSFLHIHLRRSITFLYPFFLFLRRNLVFESLSHFILKIFLLTFVIEVLDLPLILKSFTSKKCQIRIKCTQSPVVTLQRCKQTNFS